MAQAVDLFRKQQAAIAAQAIGEHVQNPRVTAGQQRSSRYTVDILTFPVDDSQFAPLQVLTEGANFGKFYYMAGYDAIGDPNHPIGG